MLWIKIRNIPGFYFPFCEMPTCLLNLKFAIQLQIVYAQTLYKVSYHIFVIVS